MTFAVLRALHAIIGTAIDDIERVYAQYPASGSLPSTPYTSPKSPAVKFQTKDPYASPPPTPGATTAGSHFPLFSDSQTLDFPSLDEPYDPSSPSEVLTSDPMVTSAISRVVSAAGQLAACTQNPFLTLCDASMGYHLPSCLRLLEASHTVEILREAGKEGLHVSELSRRNGVERGKLAHILRLLCTHHILRELRPDVFALNRISSLIDSGKKVEEIRQFRSRPEAKYHDTDGIAAFVGLCTDELQKASAYLTEAYLLSPSPKTRSARDPTRAPFSYAFGWSLPQPPGSNANRFRLERFGKAMTGTCLWDTPGGVLSAFPWQALPRGSVVVDVGGGIGSTTMLLASAFASTSAPILPPSPSTEYGDFGLKFIIQDRGVVCEMGEKAWREQCPSLLDSGAVKFQGKCKERPIAPSYKLPVHDFFTAQPIRNAAVFFLRVILHDWPDSFAQRILLRLREAAKSDTKLVIADFVLPLACADDMGLADGTAEGETRIEGAESRLAPAPLLANLGKSSAIAYWMDLTMQVTFNGQERTLREVVALTASAGWKVTKVVHTAGSLFGYLIAEP
ncbi:S-adenosyl-L-methionine-dependent methyltransferase, partial [Pluteus cervinus]